MISDKDFDLSAADIRDEWMQTLHGIGQTPSLLERYLVYSNNNNKMVGY